MRLAVVLLFAMISLILLSCSNVDQPANVATNSVNVTPPFTPLPSVTIDELASGRKLYSTNCANCHKESGTGGEVEFEGKKLNPDDLTSAKVKRFADDKILRIVANGIEDDGMPAFKDKLSEAEMRD